MIYWPAQGESPNSLQYASIMLSVFVANAAVSCVLDDHQLDQRVWTCWYLDHVELLDKAAEWGSGNGSSYKDQWLMRRHMIHETGPGAIQVEQQHIWYKISFAEGALQRGCFLEEPWRHCVHALGHTGWGCAHIYSICQEEHTKLLKTHLVTS